MRTVFSFSLLLALLGTVSAQFNIFEQMFGGGGGGGQHQQQQQQNVPSDSSYYRSQVDRGTSAPGHPLLFSADALTSLAKQRTAPTTCALTRSLASTSHTTAPAPGRATRTKSSWRMGRASVCPRADTRLARLHGRSSWRGRACCEGHPLGDKVLRGNYFSRRCGREGIED